MVNAFLFYHFYNLKLITDDFNARKLIRMRFLSLNNRRKRKMRHAMSCNPRCRRAAVRNEQRDGKQDHLGKYPASVIAAYRAPLPLPESP
jgi:hypothetical protein